MYVNALKDHYVVDKGTTKLMITAESCFSLNEETLFLVNNLPVKGEKADYLGALKELGVLVPEKVFDKLVFIKALSELAPEPLYKKIFSFVVSPKLTLIPAKFQESFLGRFAAPGAGIKRRITLGVVYSALIGIALSVVFIYGSQITASAGSALWATILLVLGGILVHELGHSFMAFFNEIGFRPIGFSVYLFYPVFYTNVAGMDDISLSGKLSINLAGIAFQSAYMGILSGLFLATGRPEFVEAVKYLAVIVMFNINPMLRTDAYWCYQDVRGAFGSFKWFRWVHYLFLVLFLGFSLFILWKAGQIAWGVVIMLRVQISALSLDFNWIRILLHTYLLLFLFKGGVLRIKEVYGEFRVKP